MPIVRTVVVARVPCFVLVMVRSAAVFAPHGAARPKVRAVVGFAVPAVVALLVVATVAKVVAPWPVLSVPVVPAVIVPGLAEVAAIATAAGIAVATIVVVVPGMEVPRLPVVASLSFGTTVQFSLGMRLPRILIVTGRVCTSVVPGFARLLLRRFAPLGKGLRLRWFTLGVGRCRGVPIRLVPTIGVRKLLRCRTRLSEIGRAHV